MIYVTGATGFIGSRVARRLLERGDRVRCLVRNPARAAELKRLGAELITGDLSDPGTHRRGLQDATAAIHLAAIYDIGIVDADAMERTNVGGTRAFLDAVAAAHTPRALYISSVVAFGPTKDQDEPSDAYGPPYHSVYHRTKAEAHGLARAAQQRGVPLIIICPAFVYGPGDEGPAGRFVRDLIRRKMPALLSRPSEFSYVHVDDVAAGIVAALDEGQLGEVYILSGENTTMNDFAARVARSARVAPPPLRFPVMVARALGHVLDPIARRTGWRFPITREAVSTTAVERWIYAHTKASRDFGYNPRDLDTGLVDTVAWAMKQ